MVATLLHVSNLTQGTMAEHNLFLGTARKSVGDVTLMRRAGRQIARVRLRTISNPKSEAQAIQRNFVAPVARFYAPFKKVLARSFEGLNKDQSYNKFLSTNVDLAKRQQWFLTKGAPWCPMPYQLSAGTIQPVRYLIQRGDSGYNLIFNHLASSSDVTTIGGISRQFIGFGCKAGDVVTIIIVKQGSDGQYRPLTFQFVVNTADATPQSTLFGTECTFQVAEIIPVITATDNQIVAGAVLVARKADGMWKRSTQFLACSGDIVANLVSQESRDAAIASYQTPNSEEGGGVYPGGDDNLFNVSTNSGRALLFIGGQFTAQVVTVNNNKVIQLKADNYDQFYYVINDLQYPLGTNSAGSLTPSDWRMLSIFLPTSSYTDYIPLSAGSQMYQYLQSIGWTGV